MAAGLEGASFNIDVKRGQNEEAENRPSDVKGLTKGEFKIFMGALDL